MFYKKVILQIEADSEINAKLCLNLIESYLTRKFVLGQGTQGLNRIFVTFNSIKSFVLRPNLEKLSTTIVSPGLTLLFNRISSGLFFFVPDIFSVSISVQLYSFNKSNCRIKSCCFVLTLAYRNVGAN